MEFDIGDSEISDEESNSRIGITIQKLIVYSVQLPQMYNVSNEIPSTEEKISKAVYYKQTTFAEKSSYRLLIERVKFSL